ncbi:hypothetical protein [Flagellimonas flava]|uniref:Uncharacterized protein n=1 Tax=Flagellimonas flava TaxID=570519 RepID=A0A1M5M1N5_9FLAO|nr:hypothetical protein [Allomuricauda flava]SHG71165.1 hypothetical protein SAMN04488116_2215 [Allomuricauda flava]
MKKTIITLVLGTFLLFIWNAVSWMVLPFHSQTLNSLPENVLDVEALKQSDLKSGVYHYPGFPDSQSPKAMATMEQLLQSQPRIPFMVVKKEPTLLFDPVQFFWSLMINLVTVTLAYFLIKKLSPKNPKSIFLYALALGGIVALISDLSLMNWYFFPLDYTLVNLMDRIVSFGLLGVLFGIYTFKNTSDG